MARFSICGGDDGEGSSNGRSRKRQRLPSIDEDEEDAGSSGEEDEEEEARNNLYCPGRRMESDDRRSTSDDSDREVVIEEERRFEKSVNNQSSSSKDSSLSLTLTDPDVLDCPICCEPLKIPIFQCDNGHLACSLCCTKVRNRCPSCTLPIGYIRCRAMEKVIEASRVSCSNAKYGCQDNILYGNRFSHEKLCVFTPCSCPIRSCNYIGNYKDLKDHVGAIHQDGLVPFVWNTSLTICLGFEDLIFREENDGEVIVLQVFRGLHVVYVTVSCVAPLASGAGNFSCCIKSETVDSSLRHGLMVKNIQKVWNECPKDGFMVVPSYMLSDDFVISLGHGRTSVHS